MDLNEVLRDALIEDDLANEISEAVQKGEDLEAVLARLDKEADESLAELYDELS